MWDGYNGSWSAIDARGAVVCLPVSMVAHQETDALLMNTQNIYFREEIRQIRQISVHVG